MAASERVQITSYSLWSLCGFKALRKALVAAPLAWRQRAQSGIPD